MKLHNKLKFIYLLLVIALFFGCGSGETAKDTGGTLTIHSPSFPEIQGMVSKVVAYLEEGVAGFSCQLNVDGDTTLSGQCSGISNGTHTYTLKYVHTDTGVILATTVVAATMEQGQNHDITFPALSKNYDDDGDGYANVVEIDSGSNPKDPNSHPNDTTSPATPALISPTAGSSTGNDKPAFDWTDVTDPSGVSYEIQVDNDSDFSSLAINEVGLTASNYTITYPLADGTYYWRVRARDGSGNIATDGYAGNPSGWSGSWSITVSKTDKTFGLVAYYPFNSNANDASGNGYNGTVTGATLTTDRFGNANSAYSFDGVNDYIGLTNTGSLNFNPSADGFTLAAWVKFTADMPDNGIIGKFDYMLGAGNYGFGGPSNVFGFGINGPAPRLATTETYNDGTWHLVVGVYGSATQYLYVDGVLKSSQANTYYPSTNYDEISIGRHGAGGGYFSGLIDDVRIYNRALSASEIQNLYDIQIPSVPTGVTAVAGDGQTIISWNAVGGATYYNIYWSTTPGVSKTTGTKISGITSTSYTHTGLTNGTTYYYVVTAVNSYGESNGSSPPVSATPQGVGLIAYYPFNGNANDASGNGYNGTVNGATLTADRFGNANSAYSFDGVNNYIGLSNTSTLNSTSGGFTLAAWVNFSNTNTDRMIIGKHSCGYNNGYFLGVGGANGTASNRLNFFVNSDPRVLTTETYNDGNWHFVLGVYDGTTQYLYVDGVLKTSQVKTYSSTNNIDISIGRASGSCGFFSGLIDDVRIYNRALAESEIQTLYDVQIPSAPTGVTAAAGDGQATISWTAVNGATSYNLYWSTTSGVSKTSYSGKISNVTSPYSHTGLTNGTTYYYVVTAVNSYGESNGSSPPVSATPQGVGLIAYYPFNGNANDASGNGYNGTVNGATLTADRFGNANSAYSFDGINDFVKVPKSLSLDVGGQVTMEFWMKPDSVSSIQGIVTTDFYAVGIRPGGVYSYISTNSGASFPSAPGTGGYAATTGVWHHIAGVYDGASLKLYIDGAVMAETTASGNISPMLNNSFLSIGSEDGRSTCSSCIGTRYFKGLIDEVKIYNKALSASEIQSLYSGQVPSVPTGVTAAADDSQATISWNSVSGATSYNIYWSTTSGVSKTSYTGKISNVSTPYIHTGLTNGTTYYYVVTAVNSYGESNGSSPPVSATPQGVGLIAYYPFNGNANDASGNGYNGTVNGATLTADRFGNANSAYSFDGVNNYIGLSNTSTLNSTSGGFTLAAWVNFSNTNTDRMIIGKHSCGYNNGYFLGVGGANGTASNRLNFFVNSDPRVLTTETYNDGNWHFVLGVYDGTTQYLYVDGVLKTSQVKTYSSTNNIDISIGRASGSCGFFSGLIDDVRIYNRALSASEIQNLYDIQIPSVPTGVTAVAGDGQATISWNSVSGATSYNIYWSTTPGVSKTTGTKISGITSTSYTHTGLTNGTTYYYVVTGVNSSGESVESSPPVPAILQAIPVLQVIPISLDFGSSNTISSLNISNTGTGTLTWSVTDDKTWLTVTPLSGDTTTETDTLTVTVDRTGLVRGSDTGKISITSNGGDQYIPVTMSVSNHVPVITSSCPTTAQINAAYTCDVNATDGDGDTLTYSLTTAPSGMTIDPNTGVISWTPAAGGSYSVTVSVNDGNSGFATQGFSISAGSFVSGRISAITTWTCANSPYIVTGSILVNSGVTLTIEPCVTVKFDSGKALQIDGTLIARGNSTNKITFTSNQSTKAPGDWGYILFSDSSTDAVYDTNGNYTGGSVLEYCTIEYAGEASISNNGAVRIDNAHPFINYCTIRNNGTSTNLASGIYGYNLTSTLNIMNSTISNNIGNGISTSGAGWLTVSGTVTIRNCMVSNNSGPGISGDGVTTTISNNTISANTGNGISANYSTVTISNNTIDTNIGSGIGIGPFWSLPPIGSIATILNNIISNNTGGGISIVSSTATISNNIVSGNIASNGGGIGGYSSTVTISNNMISKNTASGYGGGIYGVQTISNNTIFNNSAYYAGGMYSYTTASNNTITANRTTGVSPVYTIYSGDTTSSLNNNNIFRNTSTYELYNWNAQGSANLNAENNWWGSATESQYWAYDWLDDATKGVVDYIPWDVTIRTDAPISPPAGLTATAGTGQISLIWTANQEADTAGYRVYWSTVSGFPYVSSVNVGNVTNYTIPGLSPGTYYVTVTAYDTTYNAANDDSATIVNDNQTNGNESWYAVEQMVTVP